MATCEFWQLTPTLHSCQSKSTQLILKEKVCVCWGDEIVLATAVCSDSALRCLSLHFGQLSVLSGRVDWTCKAPYQVPVYPKHFTQSFTHSCTLSHTDDDKLQHSLLWLRAHRQNRGCHWTLRPPPAGMAGKVACPRTQWLRWMK